jgi:hypothetical protein
VSIVRCDDLGLVLIVVGTMLMVLAALTWSGLL